MSPASTMCVSGRGGKCYRGALAVLVGFHIKCKEADGLGLGLQPEPPHVLIHLENLEQNLHFSVNVERERPREKTLKHKDSSVTVSGCKDCLCHKCS